MGAEVEGRFGVPKNPRVPFEIMKRELLLPPDILQRTSTLANATLQDNLVVVRVNGREYRSTVPSKDFYVHQWNWDAAAVAMGLIHVDPARAYDELRSLVSGQLPNGMIPHVIYNPDESSYYPQAERWRINRYGEEGRITSGITQPPLLAVALDYVYRHTPDKEAADQFLRDFLPATMRYHDYLKKYRDPEDSGLLTIVHPWESGTDNSLRFDKFHTQIDAAEILQEVIYDVNRNRVDNKKGKTAHRPRREQYYRYMHLVDQYARWGWDDAFIVANSPFALKDILFSSIWARANDSLADMLDVAGMREDAVIYRKYADQTRQALAATWSDEHQQYCDIDVSRGSYEPIVEPTSAMFAPLYAGAVTDRQLPQVLARLSDPRTFWPEYPIPSVALNSPKFDLTRYWRGPAWPIINEIVSGGLLRYAATNDKAREMGEELMARTLAMIAKNGFDEYYDPKGRGRTGRRNPREHLGFGNFSWSAAIFIKMLADYMDLQNEHEQYTFGPPIAKDLAPGTFVEVPEIPSS